MDDLATRFERLHGTVGTLKKELKAAQNQLSALADKHNSVVNMTGQLGLVINILTKKIGLTNEEYKEALTKAIADATVAKSDKSEGATAKSPPSDSGDEQARISGPTGGGDAEPRFGGNDGNASEDALSESLRTDSTIDCSIDNGTIDDRE